MTRAKRITADLPEDLLEEAMGVTGKGITDTLVEGLRLVRHTRAQVSQVIQVPAEFRQALHNVSHRAMAASLSCCVRRRKGAKSAARSWASRTKA
jgi:hypothetical protein